MQDCSVNSRVCEYSTGSVASGILKQTLCNNHSIRIKVTEVPFFSKLWYFMAFYGKTSSLKMSLPLKNESSRGSLGWRISNLCLRRESFFSFLHSLSLLLVMESIYQKALYRLHLWLSRTRFFAFKATGSSNPPETTRPGRGQKPPERIWIRTWDSQSSGPRPGDSHIHYTDSSRLSAGSLS